jgi:hypothetical protein
MLQSNLIRHIIKGLEIIKDESFLTGGDGDAKDRPGRLI